MAGEPQGSWHVQGMNLDFVDEKILGLLVSRLRWAGPAWVGRGRQDNVHAIVPTPFQSPFSSHCTRDRGEGRNRTGSKEEGMAAWLAVKGRRVAGRFINRNCTDRSLRLQQGSRWNVAGTRMCPHVHLGIQTVAQGSGIRLRLRGCFSCCKTWMT